MGLGICLWLMGFDYLPRNTFFPWIIIKLETRVLFIIHKR